MKYKLSKYKEEIKDNEFCHVVYYQYNSGKFRIKISAKNATHARERFLEETNGDWCIIDEIKKYEQH